MDTCVQLQLVSGDQSQSAGLVFWAKDYSDYYSLSVGANGRFAVTRYVNGRYLYPVGWQDSDVLKKGTGAANQLRVVTKGTQATVYLNDKEVASFKGQAPPGGGSVGLKGESGDQPNVWQFWALKVTQ
jgi:hypothetical protein